MSEAIRTSEDETTGWFDNERDFDSSLNELSLFRDIDEEIAETWLEYELKRYGSRMLDWRLDLVATNFEIDPITRQLIVTEVIHDHERVREHNDASKRLHRRRRRDERNSKKRRREIAADRINSGLGVPRRVCMGVQNNELWKADSGNALRREHSPRSKTQSWHARSRPQG
jgi:hypothetical protein